MKFLRFVLRTLLPWGGFALQLSGVAAQNSETVYPVSYEHLNVAPAESWMFMKYGPSKPSLYTGTVRADIPLYTYRDVDFEIPVALTYSSNGLLPNVQAGSSGLGWFLSAGGAITREVNGYPDEGSGYWVHYGIIGYCSYLENMPPLKRPLMNSIIHRCGYPVIADGDVSYETTPDIYRFNFLGRSGAFIRTHEGIKVFNTSDPSGEYRISFDKVGEIVITTGDGYIYRFDQEDSHVGSQIEGREGPNYTSLNRWTLSKIEAPNGRKVLFRYSKIGDCQNRRPAGDIGKFYGTNRLEKYYYVYLDGELDKVDISHETAYSLYSCTTETDVFALNEILIDGGTQIRFMYNDRTYSERGHLPSRKLIDDRYENLKTPKKLDSIHVYRNSILLKRGTMEYAYGTDSGNPVLLLRSVELSGEGRYEMQYYDEEKPFPMHFSLSIDHWGYYNGKSTKVLYDFVPRPSINQQGIETLGSDSRDPDPTSARQGMLRYMIYPSGGCTEFSYEEHLFSKSYCTKQVDLSRYRLEPSLQYWRTGGLRIRRITDYDRLPLLNPKILNWREYVYKDDFGVGSGKLIFMPQYQSIRPMPMEDVSTSETLEDAMSAIYLIHLTEAANDARYGYDQNQTHIEYSHIYECYRDGSCRLYHFTSSDDIKDEANDEEFVGEIWDPYVPQSREDRLPCSMQSQRGKPLATSEYDHTGKLVRQQITRYGADALSYVECARSGAFTTYSQYIYTDDYPVVETTTIEYFDGTRIVNSIRYEYNELDQIIATVAAGALGDSIVVHKKYAHERQRGGEDTIFKTGNFLANPLQSVISRVNEVGGEQVIGATRYDYTMQNGYPLLSTMENARIVSGLKYRDLLEFDTKISYKYDRMGRVIETTDALGQSTCYLWGYGGLYPVAKIESMSIESLGGLISLADLPYAGELPVPVEKLLRNRREMLTVYTYRPLVGLEKLTDPAGHTTRYIYDADGKLLQVRDHEGRVLKSHEYNIVTDRKR